MRSEVTEDRRDVHCLRAILSEQDFESVGGASGREGLRRTMPSSEKYDRPGRWAEGFAVVLVGMVEVSGGVVVAGGRSQGLESS